MPHLQQALFVGGNRKTKDHLTTANNLTKNKMKKQLTFLGLATGLILASFTIKPSSDKCDDCEYNLKFIKTLNLGDDSKYELKCKSAIISYDIYQRKNGKWEKSGSSKQYDKCDLIKEMCDCK